MALVRYDLPNGAVPLFLPILVSDKFPTVAKFHDRKIDAVPVWGIHHPYLPRGEFLETEFLVEHAVEIPLYQDLTRRHLEQIARALIELATPADRDLRTRLEEREPVAV